MVQEHIAIQCIKGIYVFSRLNPLLIKILPGDRGEGGHYGLGGQIIKYSKGHKKLRQRAQNSGKTQEKI